MNYRRLNTVLIAVLFVVYLFSAKGYLEISDTEPSLATAVSLYDRGVLDVSKDEVQCFDAPNGKTYSRYGVGLPLTFVPYVALGTIVSHLLGLPRYDLMAFFLSFSNIPWGIATLFLFARLLRKLEISDRAICFMTVALGLGTLFWRYADCDFSEEIQVCLVTLIVQGIVRPNGWDVLGAGVGFAYLIFLKVIYVLLVPVLGLYLLLEFRRWANLKLLLQFCLPVLITCCLIVWMNFARFGNPFESGYGSEAHQFDFAQVGQITPLLIGSLQNGILVFCPILIFALLGWPAFFRKHAPEAFLCLGLILTNFLWTAAWHGWDGGWCWGPRLLVPLIPLWLLPAAFLIDAPARKRWMTAFVILLGISVVCQVPGILVKDQEIHHIRTNVLTETEKTGMPPDPVVVWTLLLHKLTHAEETYRTGEVTSITDRPDKIANLNSFHTFRGLNVWTELMSRQFNKPFLRWLPLLGLLGIAAILVAGLRWASPGEGAVKK